MSAAQERCMVLGENDSKIETCQRWETAPLRKGYLNVHAKDEWHLGWDGGGEASPRENSSEMEWAKSHKAQSGREGTPGAGRTLKLEKMYAWICRSLWFTCVFILKALKGFLRGRDSIKGGVEMITLTAACAMDDGHKNGYKQPSQ